MAIIAPAELRNTDAQSPEALRKAIILGVGLMLIAGVMSSVLHVGVRLTGPHLPVIEIVAIRSLFTGLATAPMLIRQGGGAWRTNNLRLQLLRGLVGVTSMTVWYYALTVLPLGDAGALSFTTAVFVMIGAGLWFREPIGWRRWLAVAICIGGVVVVLKPGAGLVSIGALAAIGSSMLWALSLLMAKQLARYDSSLTISFYQPITILPIAALATIPVWVWPTPFEWVILVIMGIAAAIGNYGYVHALRIADASITMPVDYLRLIWMVGWGFLLFGEIPEPTMWLGAALIIGATFWLTWTESRARKLKTAKDAKP